MKTTAPATPPRKLTFWTTTSLVVGNMIGSGIFLLPAALAVYGPISLVGWVFTASGAMLLALTFARLARMRSATGGPYAYSRAAYGEFTGFLIAWGYWIGLWCGNAAVAVAFAGYAGFFIAGAADDKALGLVLSLSAIWILTWVNIRSVYAAGRLQLATTVLKVLPLLFVAALGLFYHQPEHFAPFNASAQTSFNAVAACAALTLWAFLGLESATVPAGDVETPGKTIPRATVVGTAFTAVLYILVTSAVLGIVPRETLINSTAPLADATERAIGGGGALIAFSACVATLGTLNGFTLLSGQIPLSAARDRLFPRAFERLSQRGTPAFALVVSNGLASVLVAMNFSKALVDQFTFIILLATFTTLVPYLFCALAELLIRLHERQRGGHTDGVTGDRGMSFALIALAMLAFAYSMWAVYGAGRQIVFLGFLLLVAGVPVYVGLKWHAQGLGVSTHSANKRSSL